MSADETPFVPIPLKTPEAVGRVTGRAHCQCAFTENRKGRMSMPGFHVEPQDVEAPGWAQLAGLVEAAKADQSVVFEPAAHMAWDDWMTVITLPAEVGQLTMVRMVQLYGSHLRRLPPAIGRMTALENLDIYTSYSLHWLPYEVTRCKQLRHSRMSTRTLYGNSKTRLPFPRLSVPIDTLTPATCSVCDRPFGAISPRLYWTTQVVGTDVVPLLVHSCSRDCTMSLPASPEGYFERPHKGGAGNGMPDFSDW